MMIVIEMTHSLIGCDLGMQVDSELNFSQLVAAAVAKPASLGSHQDRKKL